VNHPRAGKTGYFDLMKMDPASGTASDGRYVEDYNGVEVIVMGKQEETSRAMKDWFGLLKAGRRVTGTGTSDSHTISLRPVGWPRTMVCVDEDSPPRLDVDSFTAALKAGCATISNGPIVTIKSGEVRMGGLAAAPTGELKIQVEVQAASWIGTDRLQIIVDGEVSEEVSLTDAKDTLRYTGVHTVKCKADCFVVAWVDSQRSLEPVIAKRKHINPLPVPVTNPIYHDVDADAR
ncbi:unnamed protein product, partial [Laminaria digitata]